MSADHWRPAAPLEHVRARARLNAAVRAFFAARGVLEVETPILSRAGASEPHLQSFTTTFRGPGCAEGCRLYLQTSPEAPMKRLLAAGSGPIYQMAKVFRDGEAGRWHNPEFTMLEWYRPAMDYRDLAREVGELLSQVADWPPPRTMTYAQAFARFAGVEDVHALDLDGLRQLAADHDLAAVALGSDRGAWLDLLMSHLIEPHLGHEAPAVVFDFPADQAAMARVRSGPPPVAERFEVYVRGMELANGYQELTDAREQARRFAADRQRRRQAGAADVPGDEALLAALEAGMPAGSGVALGMDRLLLLMVEGETLESVLAFPIHQA